MSMTPQKMLVLAVIPSVFTVPTLFLPLVINAALCLYTGKTVDNIMMEAGFIFFPYLRKPEMQVAFLSLIY